MSRDGGGCSRAVRSLAIVGRGRRVRRSSFLDVGQVRIDSAEFAHELACELPACPLRRRLRSRVAADFAVIARAAPPGVRSRSTAGSWFATRTRCAAKSARRSSSNREHRCVILGNDGRRGATKRGHARTTGVSTMTSILRRLHARQLTNWSSSSTGHRVPPRPGDDHCARCRPNPTSVLDPPTGDQGLLGPTHQLAIARQRRIDPNRRSSRVRCRVYGVGRVGRTSCGDRSRWSSLLIAGRVPAGKQR